MAALLIAAAAAFRLIYLAWDCPLELSPDEAHYWDWSRQLDWSYLSKGPLVAWIIRASCALFGDTMFAVRLPAVVCGSLLLAGLYALTAQVYRSARLALAVMAVAMTLPIVAAGSALMTIDAPFTCAWMWGLVFAWRGLSRPAWWAWPAAGFCLMLGMLAKHTMVLFVPSLGLFLLTTPAFRAHLLRPEFWVMAGLGAVGAAPILVWNVGNDWVTFKHAQMHAGLEDRFALHAMGPFAYVGMQFGVLLGVWFVAWARAMWAHRPTCEGHPERGFLWWMSAPTIAFFGLFSLTNGGGEANWPIAGYLSGMVLAAGWLRAEWRIGAARRVLAWSMTSAAVLGVIVIVIMHAPMQVQPVLLSIAGSGDMNEAPVQRIDLTARLRGWRHLAGEVDRARAELRTRGIEPVLATERWTQAAELSFYCADQPRFHCLGLALGDHRTQYDLWRPNPSADAGQFRGRTFLIAGFGLERLAGWFDFMEPAQTVEYREHGRLIVAWTIVVAHGYRGGAVGESLKRQAESSLPADSPMK